MATTNTTREAVTPDSFLDDKSSRHDLLRWLNNLMKTSFTDVMQTNSGACHCQLMDWLYPGSVDVSRVRFQADGMDDYKHNFTLLQEAFRGRHVTKDIPVEELVSGDFKANLHFLKWFKDFFTENLDNQEYDVVAARSGQDIHPTGPVPNAQNQKIRKRDSVSDSTEDEACNHRLKKAQKIPYDPAWKDQCPWAEPSPKGEHSTYCSVCKLHLSTSHRGLHDIRRHEESTKHRTRSQKTDGGTARETTMEEPPPLACSAAAVRFILKHCYSGASALGERAARHYPRYMLGLLYPGDVESACKQTPYSLYVYGGLARGEAQGLDDSTLYCAVLAGHFDAKASRYVVRLLDVVEDGGGGAAVADVVKRFDDGRAANLVAVYSQGQAPEASQRMCSALKDMNPHVVALAGLYEAADRAWRAAAAKLSLSQVQELMADLHAHHSSAPTPKDGPLTALFTSPDGSVRKTPPNLYDKAGCLDLCLVVGKLAWSWDELAAYFESSREGEDKDEAGGGAEAIRSRLQDVGLRATVMFLEHAMGPLHHFQKHLQHTPSTKADLACVLEAAGSMLHTYAHRLLQPPAAARFLEGSAGLRDKASRLPAAELVGLAGGGPDLQLFLKACEGTATSEALGELAESFYEAVTRSLAESLPLRAAALKTMAQLLDPYRKLDVTSEAVRELGTTLGLCKSSGEACSLSVDFLAFHNAKQVEVKKRGDGSAAAAASAEQRWSAVLKDTESTSVLRKLLLGLMSLPCPPLEARHLYDQAVLNGDALLFSGREETETPGTTAGEEEESDSASCTTPSKGRANHSASPQRRSKTYPSVLDLVKTCEIRLTKIKSVTNGSDDDRSGKDEGPVRGDSGRQSSLRKKPPARTLFQAGKGTWARPVDGREKDGGSDSVKDTAGKNSTKGRGGRRSHVYQDGHDFQPAELVWGKLKLKKKVTWWPGMIMAWQKTSGPTMPGFRRVEWFGDGLYSEMHIYSLLPFSAFSKCFSKTDYTDVPLYADAVYQIVELAAQRCAKSFGEVEGDKVKELSFMLDWAMGGFLPSGPAGFDPPADSTGTDPVIDCPSDLPDDSDSDFQAKTKDSDSDFQAKAKDSDSDFQPMATDKTKDSDSDVPPMAPAHGPTIAPAKRKYNVLSKSKKRISVTYSREVMIKEVVKNKMKLEDFCLSCGDPETEVPHPLFEGSLCLKCKENFIETLYRYDEDGYQSYCTVCCEGQEVALCGIRSCCRCFCKDCLNILVGPGTYAKLELIDPWNCFMCDPAQCGGGGHLRRRDDWSTKVQQFFCNNSAMEFKPHRLYPSIPAQQRRPMKVLSLFDGIATGYLTLKQLGFKIDRYVASEICDDSIAVGMVRHQGKIEHVNDVRTITRKHLAEWGPFDVLIGGSPCNDLSMVNPLRKGLYEGTGRLFFEFYRILTILRPREDDDRPFFWLFENVVFMAANDKADIGRFLECNPIFIDAVKVSPAHRARYFWGNLPGMNRPLATSLDDKVNLQDCLESGRVAKFDKVRTITTKSNSIRQGKTGPLPVTMNDKEDYLWSTELEEIFGFPKHYTDVNNMGRSQRQRLLGRSWSVPVIRHLFAPLKDYFECQSIN